MNSAEVSVDVDAVLRQLKQAKDKELRLRAEKERVRKELEALRTGDLWTREAATQRELDEIKTRRRALQDREATESERLKTLDDELREKEVSAQKRRHPALDTFSAIKHAATHIVTATTPSEATQEELPRPSEKRGSVELPATVEEKVIKENNKLVQARRGSSNQEPDDAVAKLAFSIDLEKQQARIKRLEREVEQSKAAQQSGVDVWDLSPTVPTSSRARVTTRGRTKSATASECGSRDDLSTAVHDQTETELHLPPYAPSLQPLQPQSPPTGALVHMPQAASSSRHSVAACLPSMPHILTTQPPPDPRFAYPYQVSGPYLSPVMSPPVSTAPQLMPMPAYPVFSSPLSLPVAIPSAYAPWGLSSSLGVPSLPYSPAVFPQPQLFGQAPLFFSQPSASYACPPIDQDVVALQHKLDNLRLREQQNDDEKEFTKVQELLTGLQLQVSQLTRQPSDDILNERATIDKSLPSSEIDETKEPKLKAIKVRLIAFVGAKRQHLEAILKVRNERDLLEEQDKLEEMQERVEKRREDRKRDMDREAWATKQKQELMKLRLERALAKMDSSKASSKVLMPTPESKNQPYDPEVGVLICWDFVSGLALSMDKIQLTFAAYDGTIARSSIKALTSRDCEADGPQNKRAIFAASRVIKPLPASVDAIVLVEMSSLSTSTAGSKPTLRRIGWTAFELFSSDSKQSDSEVRLASGWLKLKLSTNPMPDPTKVVIRAPLSTDSTDSGGVGVNLQLRIVHGEFEEQAAAAIVDPDLNAGRYRPPESRHRKDGVELLESSDQSLSPQASHLKRSQANAAQLRGPDLPEPATHTPPTPAPEPQPFSQPPVLGRDYLDIERLRLLSSSSTSTRPPSVSVRPRSTVSAVPRNRVNAGALSLAAVPETSTFDDSSSSSPWIRVGNRLARHRQLARKLFQPGDAFDVYIDGARFLPDNVSVTNITIAALNADRSKLSPLTPNSNRITALSTSNVCHPIYNLYVEYREKTFDPTLTLVFRVDTIDMSTKQPVILAYAVFPVFLDTDTLTQPTRSSGVQYELNVGAVQLPLYTNAVLTDSIQPFSAESAVMNVPRVPCATLLVRVKTAIMSEDGLQVLSRTIVPPLEWAAYGLEEPAPAYESGEYDSTLTVPTPLEMKMYQLRDLDSRKHGTTVQQALGVLGVGAAEAHNLFPPKPTTYMDLRLAFRYQPAIGFRISIDGVHNVKLKSGSYCRILYSVAPPGSFYQSIRLTNGLHFTTTTDWTSLPTSPEFLDGYTIFRDVAAHQRLVVIIDVRAVTKIPKTNVYTSQPLAWSFLPVLNANTGSVASGSYQLPLFSGEVKLNALASSASLAALIDNIAAERMKLTMPFMDGASVFVRLEDPQVPTTGPLQPIAGATLSPMIPAKAIPRYQYDSAKVSVAKKKTPLSKQLPAGTIDKQMDAEINQAFAAELGVHHY